MRNKKAFTLLALLATILVACTSEPKPSHWIHVEGNKFIDADGKEIRTQLEIDFIATLCSKKYYIQSAYAIPDQQKYEQETASFDKTMDSFKKIIVVEKSMKPRRDDKGYVMMGVKEFLLDKDSLEA